MLLGIRLQEGVNLLCHFLKHLLRLALRIVSEVFGLPLKLLLFRIQRPLACFPVRIGELVARVSQLLAQTFDLIIERLELCLSRRELGLQCSEFPFCFRRLKHCGIEAHRDYILWS